MSMRKKRTNRIQAGHGAGGGEVDVVPEREIASVSCVYRHNSFVGLSCNGCCTNY